ncbi:MAG: long-chain fatty acid--CoA ligase [Candidatus Promineifilaceae bacterium]
MQGLMMDYQLTLRPILERANNLFAKKEIVTRMDWGIHRYTYADFYKRCCQLANALDRLGIEQGSRIGTFGWNSYRHLELYFAIPCSGNICHTLNLRLHESQLEYIVNHADDRVIFADENLLSLLEPIADKLPNVTHYVVMGEPGKPLPETTLPNVVSYEDLLSAESDSYDWPDLDENTAAAMCYTSGTTGNPKGALYSHRSIYLHALSECTTANFGLMESDVVMPLVPMFHVLSWGMPYASALMGCKQVYPTKYMAAADLAQIVADERVSFTAGVPTIWLGVLNYLEANPLDISSLRRIPCGGSAAPRFMIDTYRDKYGVEIAHAWGMTEMSPLGSLSFLKAYMGDWDEDVKAQLRAKQGLPLPHVEWRVVDEASGEVQPWDGKAVGELQVKGPCVIREYYDDERSAGSFDDGWFKTGDVVTIDSEGYMQIVDRTKDLIKSGGEWISTVDLENALMAHADVFEATVIAVAHPKWAERPLALVVTNPNSAEPPTKASLYALLSETFEKWQLPDDIVYIDEVPKTSTGKFDKKLIRQQYKTYKLPTA